MLEGLSNNSLLADTDCGETEERGVLLRVPPTLYDQMAARLAKISQQLYSGQRYIEEDGRQVDLDRRLMSSLTERRRRKQTFCYYLERRCSVEFLRTYLNADPALPTHLTDFGDRTAENPELELLAVFYESGLLEECLHRQAVERLADHVVVAPDSSWVRDSAWQKLLTAEDRAMILGRVRDKLIPKLDRDDGWFSGETRDPFFDVAEEVLNDFAEAFADAGDDVTSRVFGDALDRHSRLPDDYDDTSSWASGSMVNDPLRSPSEPRRSIFADIDEE